MDTLQLADIPEQFKGLRACLRCSLVKTFEQFYSKGCENCEFLNLYENSQAIHECTTAYFEGTIALVDPKGSWVAKWQRIGTFIPGLYAIDMLGELPDHIKAECQEIGVPYKSKSIK